MKKSAAIIKDRITTQRFSIPYRMYGNGGPHIICLNGVQQSMAMWHSFIQRFFSEYRIVVFDFPGQGKGQVLDGPKRISVDEQVEILHEVIGATGIRDFTICSASWGGVVALAYAQKYPQNVQRLLLGGMATRPNPQMIETIKKGCQMDSADREEMANVLISSFGENLPANMKNGIYRQFCTMSKERLNEFCEQGLFVLSEGDLGEVIDYKSINISTVLFRAEKDTITDQDDVEFLASQLPNCQMRTVKNVGHFLHLESDDVLEEYDTYLPRNPIPQEVPN